MLKKIFKTILLIILTVGLIFILGPRTEMDETLHPLQLTETLSELPSYLAESEASVAGLRPVTAKGIIWADSSRRVQTPISLVYIHGFSGTRNEIMPLCDSLAARLNANLYYARLTGHGVDADAMGEATLNDWLNDTNEAYEIGRLLGEKTVLIGTSMGAALATWLAAERRDSPPAALVMLSPAYAARDAARQNDLMSMLHMPWGERLLRLMTGGYIGPEPTEEELSWRTSRMRSDAYITIGAVFELLDGVDMSLIDTPVFVAYSSKDKAVEPDSTIARFQRIGATEKTLIEVKETGDPAFHLLAGKYRSPQTTIMMVDTIQSFINQVIDQERN